MQNTRIRKNREKKQDRTRNKIKKGEQTLRKPKIRKRKQQDTKTPKQGARYNVGWTDTTKRTRQTQKTTHNMNTNKGSENGRRNKGTQKQARQNKTSRETEMPERRAKTKVSKKEGIMQKKKQHEETLR